MDSIGFDFEGRGDEEWDVLMGVHFCRDNGTYINRLIGLTDMLGMSITKYLHQSSKLVAWEAGGGVRISEDGDTRDAKFLARGDDSACNFSAIRNQHFGYSGYATAVCGQWGDIQFMARVLRRHLSFHCCRLVWLANEWPPFLLDGMHGPLYPAK